jgi:hypothetical protein
VEDEELPEGEGVEEEDSRGLNKSTGSDRKSSSSLGTTPESRGSIFRRVSTSSSGSRERVQKMRLSTSSSSQVKQEEHVTPSSFGQPPRPPRPASRSSKPDRSGTGTDETGSYKEERHRHDKSVMESSFTSVSSQHSRSFTYQRISSTIPYRSTFTGLRDTVDAILLDAIRGYVHLWLWS